MRDPRLTRRAFLSGMGVAGATLLAACLSPLPTPSGIARPSPSGSAGASPTPQPSPGRRRHPSSSRCAPRSAQMLLVGFRGTDAASASAVLADISDRGLGGVVLFSVDQPTGSPVRNIVSPEQLAALTTTLQDAAADQRPAAGPAADRGRPGGRPGRAPGSGPRLPANRLGRGARRGGQPAGHAAGRARHRPHPSPGGHQPEPGAGGRPERQSGQPDHRRAGPQLRRRSAARAPPGSGVHSRPPRDRRADHAEALPGTRQLRGRHAPGRGGRDGYLAAGGARAIWRPHPRRPGRCDPDRPRLQRTPRSGAPGHAVGAPPSTASCAASSAGTGW